MCIILYFYDYLDQRRGSSGFMISFSAVHEHATGLMEGFSGDEGQPAVRRHLPHAGLITFSLSTQTFGYIRATLLARLPCL